jgi:hypothetical protein
MGGRTQPDTAPGEGAPPKRVQLSRAKGWRMPPGTVKVDRSTRWGNPFPIGGDYPTAAAAVSRFRAAVAGPVLDGKQCAPNAHPDSTIGLIIRTVVGELRGKNLACWCPLDQPCHADVLLELANADPLQSTTLERTP